MTMKPSPVRHCKLLMRRIAQYITPLLACNVQNKGVKNSPHESYLLAKSLAAAYHPPLVIHGTPQPEVALGDYIMNA